MNLAPPRFQTASSRKRFAILTTAAAMLCSPALAEDQPPAAPACHLSRLASLPMTVLSDGQLGVPVMLAGKEQMLSLGISDPYSFLYESYVKEAGLPVQNMPRVVEVNIGNAHAKLLATVPEIRIGMLAGKDKQFAVFDDAVGKGNGTVGELALDVLSGIDVDLDFDKNTLNLFSQDHCEGEVVYWAPDYAAVPFKTDATGHPSTKMQLDGKSLTVAFALNPGPGRMAMATAKRLFDIAETTPGMKPIAADAGSASVRYRYPFRQLTIEGVTVNNPVIDINPDTKECLPSLRYQAGGWNFCYGASDLELGIQEMKRLHLYFAFKEKRIYLTAATPDTAKDSPLPTSMPAQLGKPK